MAKYLRYKIKFLKSCNYIERRIQLNKQEETCTGYKEICPMNRQ